MYHFAGKAEAMNLRINDPRIEELAQELAKQTGEPLDEAVRRALQERLTREAGKAERQERLKALVAELDAIPVLDNRPADEILGYNERGLFD